MDKIYEINKLIYELISKLINIKNPEIVIEFKEYMLSKKFISYEHETIYVVCVYEDDYFHIHVDLGITDVFKEIKNLSLEELDQNMEYLTGMKWFFMAKHVYKIKGGMTIRKTYDEWLLLYPILKEYLNMTNEELELYIKLGGN